MAKVLIVEDSKSQAAIIAEIVQKAGHEAAVCAEVSSGVGQVLQASNPEIVLLDLVLLGADGKPSADGFQVCREIKRLSQNRIKVVVISAKGDEDSAEWALLQGADAFLQKPFAVEDLVAVMSQMINSGT
jgi:twitching motility two-component system response regulator PilH